LLLPDDAISPSDVFDVVAGTSTGGLIAIMLGKLHMSVAECIEQYYAMAKELFGKISIRGSISRGHWKERYSEEKFEKCFRKVAAKYRGDAAIKMVSEEGHHDILTYVYHRA
jgi:patatin-like phospholipase/acyl hydrolase